MSTAKFSIESLEKFVMDTIDLVFNNPQEYEAGAVKETVAYRFELYRDSHSLRARMVFEHLKTLLHEGTMEPDNLVEFTKGGISACCVILDIKNPYTGHKYTGDLADLP